MKIGLLTLPPTFNYGGILQAFALQQTLKNLGHETYLIDRRESAKPYSYFLELKIKNFIHNLLGNKRDWVFSDQEYKERQRLISKNTKQFINKYITPRTVEFDKSEGFYNIEKFDAYIVGSDQVWRPKYTSNIYDFFFDFLKDTQAKRISYAASFGTDKWEYNTKQTSKCKELIKKFNAVSVREDSGVNLCRKMFNTEAILVLDPTLLLTKQNYLDIIDFSKTMKHDGELMTYILDKGIDKRKIVDLFIERTNFKEFNLALSERDKNGHLQPAPPVESWLQGFNDAKFIITDSFHGTVFSILFNKPFVAIGNIDRGLSRFSSLLKLFNLENRLATSPETFEELFNTEINWVEVNHILNKKREYSLNFLKKTLS